MRILLLLILLTQSALAIDVDCYEDLSQAFRQGENDITVSESFDAQGDLGCPASDVTIEGCNNTICGKGMSGITVDNGHSLSIKDITMCEFDCADGAVVNNKTGCRIENLSGEFYGNKAENQGGVVANYSDIENLSGYFHDNSAEKNGGVLYSEFDGNINSIEGVFQNNSAKEGAGGAIFNFGNIGEINADFIENFAQDNMGGGALCNVGIIKSIKGNFINNVSNQEVIGGGGAIFNSKTIEKLAGTFLGNESKNLGGAIHNMYGLINLISDECEIEFTGNIDKDGSNAIYNQDGVLNFMADKDITFNDAITGAGTEQTININPDGYSGNVIFNNNVSNNTVNMYGGTVKFGTNTQNDTQYYGNFTEDVNFNVYGGTVDLMNENIQNTSLGNLKLNSDMNLTLDIDFENLLSDKISVNSFENSGNHINISDFNALTPATEKHYNFSLFDDNCSDKETLSQALRYTGKREMELPIYKYRIDYSNGTLNFNRIDNEFNPAVLLSPVAAQLGGYLTQLDTYTSAFRNMDMYTISERKAFLNLYAGDKYIYNKGGNIWIRPYSIFENVPLRNSPRVSNTAYGTLFGAESKPLRLKKGFSMILSPYAGYNGSHQAYGKSGIYQNGGTLGGLAMAYKNNFYTGLTANVSANGCEGNTMYGKEDFSMLMTGIASKTGYNAHIKNFVIQPNLFLAYTFVKTFDYKNAANVNITSKPLNAITISPAVKVFTSGEKDYQPYIFARMFWNIIDKTDFKANDVTLPQLSVKPFVMYGAGIRKVLRKKFGGYFQVYINNGGRNGVGLMFGLRWNL